jgi:hypothetical protein
MPLSGELPTQNGSRLRSRAQASRLHQEFLAEHGNAVVMADEGLEFKDVDGQTSDSDMEDLVNTSLPSPFDQ